MGFSHEQDVDGIFSAAILRIVLLGSEVILTNYGFENMAAVAQKVRSKIPEGPGTIIIADIGVNEESYLPVFKALQSFFSKLT